MKIAHLLSYGARFPLEKHNGRYEWAHRLAVHQARDGHEVTIYAGPSTSDHYGIIYKTIDPNNQLAKERNISLLKGAFSNDHDIFHSHFDDLHYSLGQNTQKPIVTTQHWFPNTKIAQAASQAKSTNIHTVPVTYFMKKMDDKLGIPSEPVIYHGIDLSLFTPVKQPEKNRLIYVGRIAEHKGIYETVKLISDKNLSLDIVGKINDKDMDYWNGILHYVDGARIRYLGAKNQGEVSGLLANAKALLFLPHDIEAFGQTIIEAQACGTPVIINDLGANTELVENGKTGYIMKSNSELQTAIDTVSTLNPADCRAFAEKFNLDTMVAEYESLYRRLKLIN